MSESGSTRPGKNGGGALKNGNTKNVGRLRKDAKIAYAKAAVAATKDLMKIIQQKPCIPVPGQTHKNGRPVFRQPTFDEWKWAVEQANRYGVGTAIDTEADDTGVTRVIYEFD